LISGHLFKSDLCLGEEVVVVPVHESLGVVIGYSVVDRSVYNHFEWP
jgi:hypothetical protein